MTQVTITLNEKQDKAVRRYMVEFDLRSKQSALQSMVDSYVEAAEVRLHEGWAMHGLWVLD